VAVSIIVAFAQRAIAVEDVGAIASLRSGWRILRAHLGTSILLWLIGLLLGVGGTIVVIVALVVLGAIVLGISVALVAAAGASLWAAVPFVLVGLAALWVVAAIVNTFFWHYWTIAYLRLTGQAEPQPVEGG